MPFAYTHSFSNKQISPELKRSHSLHLLTQLLWDSMCGPLPTLPFTQAECSVLSWHEGKAAEGFVPFRCPGEESLGGGGGGGGERGRPGPGASLLRKVTVPAPDDADSKGRGLL